MERLFLVLFNWFRISDRSIQVEENPHMPLDFGKGWPRPLNWGEIFSNYSKYSTNAFYFSLEEFRE